jgi:hypothetical protein
MIPRWRGNNKEAVQREMMKSAKSPDQTDVQVRWSEQELAHFRHAVNLLWDAGLSFETDTGLTDEGEPWFVFCDAQSGEVAAHFAKISGKFVVWTPFFTGAITWRVFTNLIEHFDFLCRQSVSPSTTSVSASVEGGR